MAEEITMRIKCCRICGNKKLVKIGSLGKIAISDFTTEPSEGHKYPLELVYCEKCTLLQLAHNTPRDLLYKNYWYESRLNPVVVADLKEIASLVKGDIIDIGANDGTLLKYANVYHKTAVDPSNIKPENATEWIQDYWENVRLPYKAYTITAIACLYDLPNPNKFIENIKRHLDREGTFISQFQPLEQMVELNDLGNICHEHLEYYSYKSLVYLFEKNGLEIFKVQRNKMNGGSYRIFARHYKKGSIKFKEKEYKVGDLKDFFKRIEKNKQDFLKWLLDSKSKKIRGYGASTKANTILAYYSDMREILVYVVDINPDKIGKYMEQGQKIIGEIPPDTEYLWVFPYGFLDYFKKKEKNYKGKWITTIPKFQII